jgi:polyribonucleotide nucleotidyltransferase
MFNSTPVRHTVNWHNQTLTLETGLLANQASASVLASIGETVVLAAVVLGKPTSQDWLPLQVVYEERLYASGKIKGSRFIKREGRPSENAVLTGRLVDRSIRSLFNKNVRQEIQVVITVLSLDEINSPDTLAVLAASAALNLCGFVAEESSLGKEIIFKGVTSAVRIGMVEPSIANLLLQKLESEIEKAETINDVRNTLTEIAHSVDKNITVEQEGLEKIFTVLGRKNPEWAAKFRIAYQGATQLPRKTALENNKLSTSITVNPNYQEVESSILDLVVSGDGQNIVMIEAGAKIIDEDLMIKAMEKANQELSFLGNFQAEFIKLAKPKTLTVSLKIANPVAKEYWVSKKPLLESILFSTSDKTIRNQAVEDVLKVAKEAVVFQINKLADENKVQEFELPNPNLDFWKAYSKDEWFEFFAVHESHFENIKDLLQSLDIAMEDTIAEIVKEVLLNQEKRLDGRKIDEIRPITSQVGVLPRTHGSSLFQRGQTQVLNILTLGTNEDAQILDDMEDFEETTKRYIHHYNFPPYSVGETGRYVGPGRREIGHGALAEKALLPVLPSQEEFPYTIRLVSECLGSNGSTSMASTCASTLSLMDAGVPIKAIVAGVAMGLVIDNKTKEFKVITDIQGAEDHYGDMDFKVTGTDLGITALQLDNKVAGLSLDILKEALEKAKIARIFILNKMLETISAPKKELSVYAPRVQTVSVPLDKIGEVIGPSGKMIKSIIAETGTTIDIDDKTGIVYVYGKDSIKVEQAIKIISSLVKEYAVGDIVSGEVFRMEAYGAFIKIDGTDKEGLIHISQISTDRIGKVQDVLKMGQIVEAKVIEVNEKGQLSLSIKELIKK